jgi:predicted AlkP superfamily phosphohydrolase/phosphomutase
MAWDARVREVGFEHALPLDWSRTRAYVATAEIYGLLYVNLRGREPHGIVAPGTERDTLCQELQQRLLGVCDPKDHLPVFRDIVPGDAIDTDDRYGRRPDLVLIPRDGLTAYRDINDRLWLDRYQHVAGTHRPEGVFVAAGPGIRRDTRLPSLDIVDIAPTLLAAGGLPIPDDMDGRPALEIFDTAPHVAFVPASQHANDRGSLLSPEDEQVLADRLRALGYMT